MTVDEAQANPDTVIGTMFVFGTPPRFFMLGLTGLSSVQHSHCMPIENWPRLRINWLLLNLWENRFFIPRYSKDVKS